MNKYFNNLTHFAIGLNHFKTTLIESVVPFCAQTHPSEACDIRLVPVPLIVNHLVADATRLSILNHKPRTVRNC